MPFIGEQPTQASNFNVAGRSESVAVIISGGTFIVTTRAGTVEVGIL